MGTNIVQGSLSQISQQTGRSIAQSFLSARMVIIFDSSGSMAQHDGRGGNSRYEVALEELTALQKNNPGEIAVIAFSDTVEFVPGGWPPYMGGGTNLTDALQFAKRADVPDMQFTVISDGEPDDELSALGIASTYKARINAVYVGPESYPYGRDFLQRLAASSGGQYATADLCQNLAQTVQHMLTAA